ncbi:MAG: chemotaxis response regulator protein-glutamate methylesterase [Bacteriovorax sp.]|jgi:two-component system chemotaxis response regulator CheB
MEIPATNKILVLVVDDSAVIRGLWSKLIDGIVDMKVVGTAVNGAAALEFLKRNSVDIVILDLEMPEMDGLTALPIMLDRHPKIKVIIASALTTKGSEMAINALTLGASDYIAKPTSLSLSNGVKEVSEELLKKIRILAPGESRKEINPIIKMPAMKITGKENFKALVIGTSTGGPNALAVVLKNLTSSFDLPIIIVQHMPAYFIVALAERINRETKRPCQVVVDGDKIENGVIYIAPGDFHTVIEKSGNAISFKLNKEPAENFCRPAVDPLFRSAAKVYGPELLAVILTGMGEDGKRGCEEVQKVGGTIVAQDEASSVVWGMPGAVARAGLATAVLALGDIAHYVEKVVKGERV